MTEFWSILAQNWMKRIRIERDGDESWENGLQYRAMLSGPSKNATECKHRNGIAAAAWSSNSDDDATEWNEKSKIEN